MKYLLMKAGNDFDELKSLVDFELTKLYKRYYDTVEVTTDIKTKKLPNSDKEIHTLKINIDATYEGKTYSLTHNLDLINNTIDNLEEILSNLNFA
jgi:hypothetical protein